MKFILSNTKTTLSLTTAVGLALVLAGCSTPPQEADHPAEPEAAVPAEISKAPQEQETATAIPDANPNSITWLTSYDKALQAASKNNQPVMIDFYADWCEACKILDKDIYTAPDVVQKSKKFVNLKIDTDKDTDIAARYKVYALPTLIFLDGNGKVLWRLEGVPSTPHFIQTMQKVQDKFVAST